MQNIKIEGYDEYVKDFEEKCSDVDVHPDSEEEIVEELAADLETSDKLETGEKMDGCHFVLEAENCIDRKTHQFEFYFEGISNNLVKLVYGGMN